MQKQKLWIAGSFVAVFVLMFAFGRFTATHNFKWHAPIAFHKLLTISKKPKVVVQAAAEIPLNENERYLCVKFGSQCRVALDVQHAENGTEQCDRFHINPNGTIDVGFMQINSVHLKKGYTLADLIDCKKNIDIAYEIYKDSGWGAWATYKLILK